MQSPFPGMDPYLEHPALWPDVHNSLIIALRDDLAPKLAPRYYVGVEVRVYALVFDEALFVARPDVAVWPGSGFAVSQTLPLAEAGVQMVEVPVAEDIEEIYLEVRDVASAELITAIELLSPVNKIGEGRKHYLNKRAAYFSSRTNLVEIDLLRAGDPLPIVGWARPTPYRVLVSRGSQSPRAQLYSFNLSQSIPKFSLPLRQGDQEPEVDLNALLHNLYQRAHYEMRVNYAQAPQPPLAAAEAVWAAERIQQWQAARGA